MKKKKKTKEEQRSCDRCKGDGRGGECSQRSYDRWALGGGVRQARHFGLIGPSTLGPSGLSLWANQARHPWARHLGPSGLPSIKPKG